MGGEGWKMEDCCEAVQSESDSALGPVCSKHKYDEQKDRKLEADSAKLGGLEDDG